MRHLRPLLAAAALLAGGLLPLSLQSTAQAAATPNGGDAIANLFEWNWPSVAGECTTVLGPKGYGAVQVAPPEDSIRLNNGTHPWWDVYQPVGYDLNSRMGTEAQFAAMVTACHNAGVKVYADAVVNHAAGSNQTSTDSYGGASFNPATYNYWSIGYNRSSFHDYPADCPNSGNVINDWNNVQQVQECQLVSLSDLYTEKDEVRAKIAGYLNKLIGYGVDGFRVDAAKHIAQADFGNIISRLNNTAWGSRPYIYQEVFPGSSGQLAPSAFESNGSLLEFDYAYDMKSRFTGDIANLQGFGQSSGLEPSDKAAVMVTNHDLERNGSTLSYKDGSKYTLATVFELAYGYGTPQVYSGFSFSSNDQSPPADANGYVTATDCSSSAWVCTDRNQGIANMVGWHNAGKGRPVANWWSGSNAIAFSRGSAAWVAINNSGSALTRTFATGLAAGTYCDVIHGDLQTGGGCGGPTVTVNAAGQATVTVGAGDAVALYATGAPCSSCPTSTPTPTPTPTPSSSPSSSPSSGLVNETFNETRTTVAGQNVYLVGSLPALGNWAPAAAVPLSSAAYPVWSATVGLPANTSFEYKYILKDAAGNVTWESGSNHAAGTGSSGGTLNDSWNGGSSAGQVTVDFSENRTTVWGQNVYLVGSLAALGSWDPNTAVALSSAAYPNWTGSVTLPPNTSFEYKYLVKDAAGNVTWESGANRTGTTGAAGSVNLNDSWK
ncbi:carbohydrate-binding module family 20 domain-containing protein [Kitasatospora azatica]|uniref:carbohydrate-binding module family 20 domain-containing protein n=1 Tax=Kitasatospora azatica TaxID=58347 RepID=UPI000AE6A616|nr:carbohydrate-binding module family 20 domain-containing protein [Kitasatospora azatica]